MTKALLENARTKIQNSSMLSKLILGETSADKFISKKDHVDLPYSVCYLENDEAIHPVLIGPRLGQSNNVVKLALNLLTQEFVALKILKNADQNEEAALFAAQEEKRELKSLVQFNRFRGGSVVQKNDREVKYFAQSLIEGADLQSYIQELENHAMMTTNKDTLKNIFDEVVRVSYQICKGVQEFHEQGFLHRDLKPANMILDKNHPMKVTLVDFGGLVSIKDNKDLEDYGTQAFKSPEVQAGAAHSEASEAFATGKTMKDIIGLLQNGKFRLITMRGEGKTIYNTLNNVCEKLMKADPIERMSVAQAATALKSLVNDNPEEMRKLGVN